MREETQIYRVRVLEGDDGDNESWTWRMNLDKATDFYDRELLEENQPIHEVHKPPYKIEIVFANTQFKNYLHIKNFGIVRSKIIHHPLHDYAGAF